MPAKRPSLQTARQRANLTIPELENTKAAALGTLVSLHSRRAYKNAIDRFTAWYCSEPRLGFNGSTAPSCCDTARSSNHSHCQLRRLIFISPRSAV
jgi:hypothetical protein